ncbi:MAG: Hemerythrin cation binding domain protein [Actinoallomurus sp.]|jgi:hemerythrin-like domain-containing protein|nr:Hemerythrin cation binding domain protein [Actinoallomurus sp.]
MDSSAESVIDLLISDHRRMEGRLLELRRTPDAGERRRLADQLVIECVRHSVIEEIYLHPMIEKALPHGADRIAKETMEHVAIERRFEELERTDTAGRQFEDLVTALMAETHQHILNEEHSLFTWVVQYTNPSELAEVGERVQGFEDDVPDVTAGPGLTRRVRQVLGGRRHP